MTDFTEIGSLCHYWGPKPLIYCIFTRKNDTDLVFHHAKYGGVRTSQGAGKAKKVWYLILLLVHHAFER